MPHTRHIPLFFSQRFCFRGFDGECEALDSPINVFFAKTLNVDSAAGEVQEKYDGTGTLRNIDDTLRWLAREEIFWYTDSRFSLANLTR